jgi:hypothetical protein
MTASDIETGKKLLKEEFILKNPAWCKELEVMLQTKEKAEIRASFARAKRTPRAPPPPAAPCLPYSIVPSTRASHLSRAPRWAIAHIPASRRLAAPDREDTRPQH